MFSTSPLPPPGKSAPPSQRPEDRFLSSPGGEDPDESLEAFNNIHVLRALNETDKYRILGLGHATDVTLADFFADTRAQTPTAAGTALKRLLSEAREKAFLKKQLETARRKKRGPPSL